MFHHSQIQKYHSTISNKTSITLYLYLKYPLPLTVNCVEPSTLRQSICFAVPDPLMK